MSCYIGRILIVRNEGTVIIGNVGTVAPSDSSTTVEGAGEENTVELTKDAVQDAIRQAKTASTHRRSRTR